MLWTPPSWDNPPTLVLASQSPRRKALLEQLGIEIATLATHTNEQARPQESPHALVQRLAEAKACAGAEQLSDALTAAELPKALRGQWRNLWVLGADTLVVDGEDVLAKPTDRAAGEAYLRRLSGRTHRVMTGVSVTSVNHLAKGGTPLWQYLGETEVTFCTLREAWVQTYWDTGEPQDKAGGYGIQGFGGLFVESIKGSYSNVVGLPVEVVGRWLAVQGAPLWQAVGIRVKA